MPGPNVASLKMLVFSLLTAAAATLPTPPSQPAQVLRAQARASVRIIQAAEVRGGRSDLRHHRSVRRDEAVQTLVVLQFE